MPQEDRPVSQKVLENRLRRTAARRGLQLKKSGTRDPLSVDYGMWWVYKAAGTRQWPTWELLTPRDGLTLSEVEEFVAAYRARRVPPDISELVGASARPVPGRPT
jgi:hypothetical protein